MDWNLIIGNVISAITLIISVIVTATFKKVNHILLGEIAMNLLVALSFVFLGGLSGAWVCIVATVQTVILFFANERQISKTARTVITVIFLAAYVVGTAVVYVDWKDIVACLCAFFYVFAVCATKSANYRWFMLVNSLLWVIYDIKTAAFVNIITHGITAVSTIIGKIRLDWKKEK